MNDDKKTITVQIANLTDSQVIALKDLFYWWNRLGSIGASRWTAFFADGDGNFRPFIRVDGQRPEPYKDTGGGFEKPDGKGRWKPEFGGIYMVDFDKIKTEEIEDNQP